MRHLSPKERILAERGLHRVRPASNKHTRFEPSPPIIAGRYKTALMKYLEHKYHLPIEEVLTSGSLAVVAKRLGNEVDFTTISRWIKRFKLRYVNGNIPDCEGCNQRATSCDVGVCPILMGMGLYDLAMEKRYKMMEGNHEGNQPTNQGVEELS